MDVSSNDYWASHLKRKEETNRLLDQQLIRKSLEDKKAYKQELDLQSATKTQDKVLEKEQKKTELIQQHLKSNLLVSDELRKRKEKLDMQKFLAKQYEFQSNYLKNKQKLDYLSKIEDEKKKIQQIESTILKDSQSKQMQKKNIMKEEQEVLQHFAQVKIEKEIKTLQDKQKDIDFLKQRAEQDDIREKNNRDFYRKREDHQNYLEKMYTSQVSPKLSEKSKKIDIWIEKNMENQARVLKAKEDYEQVIKKETMNNIKQVWKYQIEEKNERLNKIKEEQQNIYFAIQSQVNESKRLENLRGAENLAFKNGFTPRRNSGGYLENITPSTVKNRSGSVAPRPAPVSLKDSVSEVSCSSYHNPITNPIGDSPRRPVIKPLYRPHTLIAN